MSPFPSVFQNKYLIRDYYIKIKPECGNKKLYQLFVSADYQLFNINFNIEIKQLYSYHNF